MSDSIITLDVGGQIFKTHVSTLTKYPDSMLAVMFNHTDQGLAPMPKTKEGAYFLEADPIYFREILNYLRYGQSTEDPDLFRGVKNLADYLGLTDMIKELESEQFVRGTDHGSSNSSSWVTLDLQGTRKVKIPRKYLRRVPDSLLAMFFSGSGEQKSQNPLSEWILMEAPNRYYIDRDNFEVFQFLRMSKYEPRVAMDHFVLELEFYGIVRNQHYTIEPKSQFEPSPVFRWNENYNVS